MKKFFDLFENIKPFYDMTDKVVMVICKLLLIIDILIASYTVVSRKVPFLPDYSWSEEVILTCMAYMTVLSAALAIRYKSHIRMTALDTYLPEKLIKFLDVLADIVVMVLGVIMLYYGWIYAVNIGARGTYVSMPWLSRFWMYFPIPLAGVAMIIFEIETLVNDLKLLIIKEEA